MRGETFYDLLGVDSGVTAEDIEHAYRERVKEYHPDVSAHPNARERFKRINLAREVLSDSDERARYDRLGHEAYLAQSRLSVPNRDQRRGETTGGTTETNRETDGPNRETDGTSRETTGETNASRGEGNASGGERNGNGVDEDTRSRERDGKSGHTGWSSRARSSGADRRDRTRGRRTSAAADASGRASSDTTSRDATSAEGASGDTASAGTASNTTESSSATSNRTDSDSGPRWTTAASRGPAGRRDSWSRRQWESHLSGESSASASDGATATGRFAVREAVVVGLLAAVGFALTAGRITSTGATVTAILLVSWVVVALVVGWLAAAGVDALPDDVVRAHAFPVLLFGAAWYVHIGTERGLLAAGLAVYAGQAMLLRSTALAAGRDGSSLGGSALWFVGTAPVVVALYVTQATPNGVEGVLASVVSRIIRQITATVGSGLLVVMVAFPLVVGLGHALWRLGRALG